jgi:hypothetical protein
MLDVVSSVSRTGGTAENRRTDAVQSNRAAQEAATIEVRNKAAAAAVAAVTQPQPSQKPAEPRMETRPVSPTYVPDAGSEAGDKVAQARSARAASEEEVVEDKQDAQDYAAKNAADQDAIQQRVSQMVQRLYELPA